MMSKSHPMYNYWEERVDNRIRKIFRTASLESVSNFKYLKPIIAPDLPPHTDYIPLPELEIEFVNNQAHADDSLGSIELLDSLIKNKAKEVGSIEEDGHHSSDSDKNENGEEDATGSKKSSVPEIEDNHVASVEFDVNNLASSAHPLPDLERNVYDEENAIDIAEPDEELVESDKSSLIVREPTRSSKRSRSDKAGQSKRC